jgi:hypothetical protein
LFGAYISNQDERGNTHGIQQKYESSTDRDKNKRPRETAFLPEYQEPQDSECQDESHALETRALGCDLHLEPLRANAQAPMKPLSVLLASIVFRLSNYPQKADRATFHCT